MSTDRALGPVELTGAHWRKSAYSANSGACIEVAVLDRGGRMVRDSKDPAGPLLSFTPADWSAFTTAIRSGEFD